MPRNYYSIVFLTLFLTACSQNQDKPPGPNLEKLGYKDPSNLSTHYENMTNDLHQEDRKEQGLEDFGDEQNQNINVENDDGMINKQQEIEIGPPSQQAFPLFITDFQQRWNAVSNEQTGDVYIQQFQRLNDSYRTSLKTNLIMEIDTRDNKQIDRIKIIGTGKTNAEHLKMLTSWWQVLIITNPQSELHEIDTIFSEIGIGPNSNFEDLQAATISFGGLQYKVIPSHESISFEAIYPEESENSSLQGGT
ncbi:MAG TPA: hypothetical protein VK190_07700 [Pseudoneobacillus sp.]|nr:hypothetical protein [Pseudoneobacillus sp.]